MRQVEQSAKLAISFGVLGMPKQRCTKEVPSCSAKTATGKGTDWCHRFYKCHNGVAYSCQNPKSLSSTCSEKYYFGSMEKYRCVPPGYDDPRCK